VRDLRERARSLRQQSTDAERKLWWRLRARQVGSAKFRRQHVIGNSIVDFCCLESKLVVEVDGSQHATRLNADRRRTHILNRYGYKVLRFWDHDVLTNTEDVLEQIAEALRDPHPGPLPEGRGGG
jgi:very-short-patch-repair endonuclease